jgi:hypothetical protein
MSTETDLPGHPLDVAVRAVKGTETVYVVTDDDRPRAVILDFEYYRKQVGILAAVSGNQVLIEQKPSG